MQGTVHLPLVDQFLREQKDMTAVERFAQRHEAAEVPTQARYYQDLIPLEKPKAGQQYGFLVDLDACTGCKACVTACHNLNGLDTDEVWRSVGILHGGVEKSATQQTVTTACHHCLDPACMTGCPVNAYEKDPETGIVKHLDDQCIGCQYCTLTCPYEVPQYSKSRGIVRKCDMCSGRLEAGEAPACVQACPNEAISIRIVDQKRAIENAQGHNFLPGAPSPGTTIPTTDYKTNRVFPKNMLPADFYSVRPSTNHMPLVVMLVLTQLSVGAFVVDWLVALTSGTQAWAVLQPYQSIVALAIGLLALAASLFHLGRPQYAFRAIIGLRHSWLSREILAFGLFAKLAVVYAASFWLEPLGTTIGLPKVSPELATDIRHVLAIVVVAVGVIAVACSVMLYAVTKKRLWALSITLPRFFGTAAVLGLATTTLIATVGATTLGVEELVSAFRTLGPILAGTVLLKLIFELGLFIHLRDKQLSELKRSALLMKGELVKPVQLRFSLMAVGAGFSLLLLSAQGTTPIVFASLAFLSLLAGEFFERGLFFLAVAAPRMPGAMGR
jgi:Fe-S-cluster-containing dehydrogenase component/DMSO reductase anchor subunit